MEQIWERLEMKTGFRYQESHETTDDGQRHPKTIFDPDSFRSIKGNNEVEYLESRLGIEKELEFEFNEKKKFNCLSKPVPYCLSDAKGRKSSINKIEAMG